jgi:dihydrofolate reductase
MRKLHLQMQMTVDGFVSAGPNDDQKWVTLVWEEIRPYVTGLLDTIDTILIGRKLAVDYIPHWKGVVDQPENPFHGLAQRINSANKIVFTKTMTSTEWENTELATGDLVEEVQARKAGSGKDMIVYGGSSFVSALLRERLVDEFHLFIKSRCAR